jgi:hypothetical protein
MLAQTLEYFSASSVTCNPERIVGEIDTLPLYVARLQIFHHCTERSPRKLLGYIFEKVITPAIPRSGFELTRSHRPLVIRIDWLLLNLKCSRHFLPH